MVRNFERKLTGRFGFRLKPQSPMAKAALWLQRRSLACRWFRWVQTWHPKLQGQLPFIVPKLGFWTLQIASPAKMRWLQFGKSDRNKQLLQIGSPDTAWGGMMRLRQETPIHEKLRKLQWWQVLTCSRSFSTCQAPARWSFLYGPSRKI